MLQLFPTKLSRVVFVKSAAILRQTIFQQLSQTKSNKFNAVLIFEETVAIRIQDQELKYRLNTENGGFKPEKSRGPKARNNKCFSINSLCAWVWELWLFIQLFLRPRMIDFWRAIRPVYTLPDYFSYRINFHSEVKNNGQVFTQCRFALLPAHSFHCRHGNKRNIFCQCTKID